MNDEIKNAQQNDDEKRKRARAFLLVIAILLIFAGSVYMGFYLYSQYAAKQNDEYVSQIAQTTVQTDEKLAKNPINFDSIREKNEDIYAWIKVPKTKVDYPVVQSPDDDDFYLKHDAFSKKWSSSGAIYTELGNTQSFSDRVTVIYGHNGYGDSMFTTLHRFETKEAFAKTEYFYIYLPHRKLTYKMISAFKFDDRHILNCFDFSNNETFREFEKMIQDPDTNNKQVRSLGRELTIDDKIVVLSTCFINQRSNRYLVCGVLVKDEKTN